MESLKFEKFKNQFTVADDIKAEWVMRKMLEERTEFRRYENTCNTFIEEYKFKLQKEKEKYEAKTAHWKAMLQEYFETVVPRKTKTLETYKLPSGSLKKKIGAFDYIKEDEDKFSKWLENNGYNEFLKVKITPAWGDFKKALEIKVSNGDIITKHGEIVEGMKAVEKSDIFDVELE